MHLDPIVIITVTHFRLPSLSSSPATRKFSLRNHVNIVVSHFMVRGGKSIGKSIGKKNLLEIPEPDLNKTAPGKLWCTKSAQPVIVAL